MAGRFVEVCSKIWKLLSHAPSASPQQDRTQDANQRHWRQQREIMTNKNKGRKRAKDYKEQIIRDLRRRRLKKNNPNWS